MGKSNTVVSKSIFTSISVGMVLFSAHAGGGFATGNQANTFFISLGWTGIVSAILAMILLTATMKEAMTMYNDRGLKSYKELFSTLFHPFDKFSIFFEIFFYIMVVMAIAAAISGAASALKEYFSGSYAIYVICVGILVLTLTIFGANLVRKASTFMGIAILIAAISIYAIGSFQGENFFEVFAANYKVLGLTNLPKAILNAFIYAGFQCVTLPTMIVCGKVLENKKQVSTSMKFSFIVNTIALVLSIVMLTSWQSYYTGIEGGSTIPTLIVTNAIGWKWMFVVYGICLILCLISTGVTTTFGFVSRFEDANIIKKIKNPIKRRAIVAGFIIILSMGISMAGLTNIIKYGYGYCGYLAIAVVVVPFLTIGVYKNRTYGREIRKAVFESIQ